MTPPTADYCTQYFHTHPSPATWDTIPKLSTCALHMCSMTASAIADSHLSETSPRAPLNHFLFPHTMRWLIAGQNQRVSKRSHKTSFSFHKIQAMTLNGGERLTSGSNAVNLPSPSHAQSVQLILSLSRPDTYHLSFMFISMTFSRQSGEDSRGSVTFSIADNGKT